MYKNTKYIVALAALMAAGGTQAQNLNSAYFMDGFAYGHELNAAKDYDRDAYFSFPALGNINVGYKGNLGLKSIFYKNTSGNGLVSYLHPSLSTSDVLSKFHDNNKLTSDDRIDILSVGFHSGQAFHTITIGARINLGVNVPYSLFDLTKNLSNRDYDISDVNASAKAWLEVGYGYSRNLNNWIRLGGKFKFLIGAGYANVNFDNLNLRLSGNNEWTATANATVEAGVKGFTWGETETKEYSDAYLKQHPGSSKTYQRINLSNMDVKSPGPNGYGAALDLGAEFDLGKKELVEGLKLSVGLNDLGFIRWNKVAVAQNKGEEFKFNGYNNISVDNGPGTKMSDQSDDFGDRLSNLYSLQDEGTKSKTTGIGTTLNIAGEYALPMYPKLAFGLLSTTRIQGKYSWNEERLSANYHPFKWLEGGINFGVGSYGCSMGWIVNIHPKGFSLFIGGDNLLGKLSKQCIPLNKKTNISLGINFPLGSSHVDRKKDDFAHL